MEKESFFVDKLFVERQKLAPKWNAISQNTQ